MIALVLLITSLIVGMIIYAGQYVERERRKELMRYPVFYLMGGKYHGLRLW